MSTVPAEIAGIGLTQQKLRVSPGFDPMKANVGPDEYFLLSRIDGVQTLRDVMLATGLPVERAVAIVIKLRSLGALLLPGETVPPPAATAATPVKRPTAELDVSLPDPTAEELRALSEDNVLDAATRRRILALGRLVEARDPWALLGVPQGSNYQALKRAYFKLSKNIHPDRFYGKQLGSFRERLSTVFEATSRAYERLTSGDARPSRIAARRDRGRAAAVAAGIRGRAVRARGRRRGRRRSAGRDEAVRRGDPARRADQVLCAAPRAARSLPASRAPRSSTRRKRRASSPNDPSLARLLAIAFKAAGKLADAEEVLVMAMALKSENDALGAELRSELAEVRRLLAGG